MFRAALQGIQTTGTFRHFHVSGPVAMEICLISPDAGILLRKVPACKVLTGTDRGRENFNIESVKWLFHVQV